MVAPLGRSEAVRLLDDAAELIRQARMGTVVYHWIGSVPFSASLLFAWASVQSSRTTDADWAAESLVLALALLWMNCWRAVYAGRLRNQLSGVAERPWTPARVLQLAGVQSLFGATKLLVLPASMLILFPWAKTVAFYRHVTVLSGRDDGAARQMARRARQLAAFQATRNWSTLALLAFLQILVVANLAALLAFAPQLIRILTGYESAFSRSGIYFPMSPAFRVLVLVISWVLFDPFAQAVYCVRCFEAESMETGEDLRSGLRRIRSAALVTAALAVLMFAAPLGRAEIAPGDLERSVRQAMQTPEYDWRLPARPQTANPWWASRVLDRWLSAVRSVVEAVSDALSRLLHWLLDRLFHRGPAVQPGAPPGKGLDWMVAGLIAVVAAAGVLLAWQKSRGRRAQPGSAKFQPEPVRPDAAELTPDLLSEDRWIQMAERCLAGQDYRFALRAFYLSGLAWLGNRKFLLLNAGKTNRDYQNELNRRVRELAAARALFAGNIAAFERAWYGVHAVSLDDTARFRRSLEELKAEMVRLPGAAS